MKNTLSGMAFSPERSIDINSATFQQAELEFPIPYPELYRGLETTQQFYDTYNHAKDAYFTRQVGNFTEAASQIPGYIGTFSLGYSVSARDPEGVIHPVGEISRFVESTRTKVISSSFKALGGWACNSCQLVEDLPDLKVKCRPCDKVEFKPRDLFKALPDLDLFVIVEDDDEATEVSMEAALSGANFYPSDTSIGESFRTTVNVMQSINEGRLPTENLPVDVHIFSRRDLLGLFDRIVTLDDYGKPMLARPKTWRINWDSDDLDFLKDFLCSMKEEDIQDAEILTALERTRKFAKAVVGDEVVKIVGNLCPTDRRKLQTQVVADILKTRIENW